MREFLAAVRLDGRRLAPFPLGKYQPQRILGAGGFGVAFLCQHKYMNAPVVVKALTGADLDHGVDQVFAEATALRQMDHPAVIRIQDCGFTDSAHKARPYLVMDYFEGATLEEEAGREAFAPDACLAVARQIAEGFQAAHARGILHRDVKPANVLVRRVPAGWQAKLIDFGLALNRSALENTKVSSKTLLGGSIAGTMEYASPEQLGRLAGVAVSPASDVYGFGKTCCYALFQTAEPTLRHWQSLSPPLADLLGQCLEKPPGRRPGDFAVVLARLSAMRSDEPSAEAVRAARQAAEEERRRKEEQERRLQEAEGRAAAESLRRETEHQWLEAAARAQEERRRLEEQEQRLREATEKAEAERRRLEEQRRRSESAEGEPILEVLPARRSDPPPLPQGWNPPGTTATFYVVCPNCRRGFSMPTTSAGIRTPCPLCRSPFTVPFPKRKPGSKLGGCGCLFLLAAGVLVWLFGSGQFPELTKTIQDWFGNVLKTPGAVIASDSFTRTGLSQGDLGQLDLARGGTGKYSYAVRGSAGFLPGKFSIHDGALYHSDAGADAVEIAASNGRVENLGSDLNISVDEVVPRDAATGTITEAGPLLRDEADAASGGAVQTSVIGYWVSLNSLGEVRVKNLSTSAPFLVVASGGRPGSFDATAFHKLDVRVHGEELQASLDDVLLTFKQAGQLTKTVKLGTTTDQRRGAAGLFFGAEDNPGQAGGQRVRSLVVSVYQPFNEGLPVQNNFGASKAVFPDKDEKKDKD